MKVNANRARWTDCGLCPNPICCVGHRGDCCRVECAQRPRNYQPPAVDDQKTTRGGLEGDCPAT